MNKLLAMTAVLLFPFAGIAQTAYHVKSHQVTIEGTSNLQSWAAEAEKVNGEFTIRLEDGKLSSIENATIRVVATSIKGSEGRRMNNKIYESLDTDRHPEITFLLRDVLSLAENPGTARISSRGVLTIAGVSRSVELNTVGRVLPNGDLEFAGSQTIDMTDHSISPPTAMFGALRTGSVVELTYRVVLTEK